jgi:hypothetical protein
VNQVVACEDLNPRGYKYRILVVGSGFRWHRHWKKYTEEDKTFLVELTNFIAKYLLSIGKGKKLVKIDTEHFSYPEHGHCQACIL